jgi:hypothetical protein
MNNHIKPLPNGDFEVVPLDDPGFIAFTENRKPHILEIRNFEGKEIIKITYDGKLFWNQREVTTDQEYRDAMMYIGRRLSGIITGEEIEPI